MLLKKISQFLLGLLFTIVLLPTANAATANYSYSFVVSTVGENPYSLETGDIVTISGSYNTENASDAYSDGTYSMHSAASDEDFTFSLILNDDVTYTYDSRSSSTSDAATWPIVTFLISDWSIDNIDFQTVDDILNSYIEIMVSEIGDSITLTAFSSLYSEGEAGYWSITGSPVPIPGTLTLICLGLLGLVGINRRQSFK